MQPLDSNGERSPQGATDGRRDIERDSGINAALVALAKVLVLGDRKVHLAEPGKPVDLSANLTGQGGLKA